MQQAGDSMPFSRLSDSAQAVLAQAMDIASMYLHQHVEPEHIFLALLRGQDSSARTILEALRANVELLATEFEGHLLAQPAAGGRPPKHSTRTLQMLGRCQAE